MDTHERTVMRLAACQGWTVSRAEALVAGMSGGAIDHRVRSGTWSQLAAGFYLIAPRGSGEVPFETRVRAALHAHSGAVLAGRSACIAMGLQGLGDVWSPIELAYPDARSRPPRRRGVQVRLRQWNVGDAVGEVGGWPCTSVARALADAGLELDRFGGLSLLDSALHLGLMDRDGLAEVDALAWGRRGSLAFRALIPLADARAASALESRVRLICIDGRIPPDELQLPLVLNGRTCSYGDLAWRRSNGLWLVAEADGRSVHDRETAVTNDRRRANTLAVGSRSVIRFTWADTQVSAYVVYTVRNALAA